jgi:hypothetical protein
MVGVATVSPPFGVQAYPRTALNAHGDSARKLSVGGKLQSDGFAAPRPSAIVASRLNGLLPWWVPMGCYQCV